MITFETKYLKYSIDEKGSNVEFIDKLSGKNHLKPGFNPCGKLVKSETDRTEIFPVSASFNNPYLTVTYPSNFTVDILVGVHDTYLTFELKNVSDNNFWSLATTLIEVDTDYSEDTSFISTLMGMTLNTRMKEYPGRNNLLLAEAFTHISIDGVKCAVIGAPEPRNNGIMRQVLDEIPSGSMPKSAYSGPYACDCRDADRSYTVSFDALTPDNIDEYIRNIKKFAISQVHMHQGKMFSQGDFTVNPEFYPGGINDFKAIIDRLHSEGIQAILHTYTFFVQKTEAEIPNKYLSPVPHKDLGVCATYTLSDDISANDDFIPSVESTENVSTLFGYSIPESDLLWIDDEIIRFAGVDKNGFAKITRGVFGTNVSSHKSGAQIKQINSYFGYIAPTPGSDLFYEIARNTAEFYNECDFDGYYLDAIDGVFVLDGDEFTWYHSVDFINEVFKFNKKPPIFNCCYGPQYPGQWYARTRMGAFDTPARGYRDFVDVHVNFNEKFAEKMYLTGEMGWWSLYPGFDDRLGFFRRPMFAEDVDYVCSKALATDACPSWHGTFRDDVNVPFLEMYGEKIRLYSRLQSEKYFDKRVKDIVRKPYSEFELVKIDEEYKFRPTFTDLTKVKSFEDGRNSFKSVNKFKRQSPKIRIEGLFTADHYDCPEGDIIWDFDETKPVELNKPLPLGQISTNGNRGLGVWIYGDGKGETISLRLNSPVYRAPGYADHFIKIDFTGWRYFTFYEFENCDMKHEDWKPQGLDYKVFTDVQIFYAAYFSSVNYNCLETLNVMVNCPGDYDIRLKPVRAIPARELELKNPALEINGQKITFLTTLKSRTFIEFDPQTNEAKLYDLMGNVLDVPEIVGEAPVMDRGENTVIFTAESDSPYQKRAAITLRTFGEPI